jgi:hypothetical protein
MTMKLFSYNRQPVKEWETKIKKWRRWFAWYPVRIGDDVVWFEMLKRRAKDISYPVMTGGDMDGICVTWEYNRHRR